MDSIKIKLHTSHRHQGVEYQAGDEIEVSQHYFDWLKKRGIATEIPAPILNNHKEIKNVD